MILIQNIGTPNLNLHDYYVDIMSQTQLYEFVLILTLFKQNTHLYLEVQCNVL